MMHILRRAVRPVGAVAVIASLAFTFVGTTTSMHARADNADIPKCVQTQIPTGDLEIADRRQLAHSVRQRMVQPTQ
jgi:hypothetical protein